MNRADHELQTEYGYIIYLRKVLRMAMDYLDDLLAPIGITNQQARIIGRIHSHYLKGIPVCQKDLEREVGLQGPTITSLVQELERRGLIVRSHDANDRRVKQLALTEKGLRFPERFQEIFLQAEERIVKGMDEGERAQFLSMLRRAVQNQEMGAEPDDSDGGGNR